MKAGVCGVVDHRSSEFMIDERMTSSDSDESLTEAVVWVSPVLAL